MITADKGVQLEVLDWKGTGRPVILLSGLGDTAHIFDDFAPKLTGTYHVYGITRRGYGASSRPADGYGADRLGDDVVAVLDVLKLNKPILVGESIAGEELSSIATRCPERIAGAVYLEAAYSFALYDPKVGDWHLDLPVLQKQLELFAKQTRYSRPIVHELIDTDLPVFLKDLQNMRDYWENLPQRGSDPPPPTAADRASFPAYRAYQVRVQGFTFPEAELRNEFVTNSDGSVGRWIPNEHNGLVFDGQRKFTEPRVPVLAIFAMGNGHGTEIAAASLERLVPSAHVVRLSHADHQVFLSNEADVLKEVKSFIDSLPE
ncbi:alpha/beta hydrolase [Terriglobus albidus]|uniref:Alpha/beta hydrolase n=1 Tax=Terriglobus albidus TaxID=1592106 RepID=A0A5B9EGU2_9BACT|nr:alpha/beta hydrolase [Terriglobus albidus]QEE31252.1 alpha/beta hydrolase [Terriglobus albidus]